MLLVVAATAALGSTFSSPANAAPASQFAVESGATITTATGSPMPASGTHVALWSNAGVATTTVSGSGRIVIGGMGAYCASWPLVAVTVDGLVVGKARLRSATTYQQFFLGSALPVGAHQVRISMTNDYSTVSCDRNSFISYAYMENPSAPPPTQPDATNTGVPDGTALTQFYGNMTITVAGTVVNAMDIHGFVDIRANNVTIKNSIVRGADPGASNLALISNYGSNTNLVIVNTTLLGAVSSNNLDGLKGKNFTATRLDISNVVDTVQILGDNSTVQDSWLHDNLHLPDSRKADGWTHDDNIQVEGGNNILIQHNTFEDSNNAAVMVTQNVSTTVNIRIDDNWINGGACSINVDDKGRGAIQGFTISNNRFTQPYYVNCGVKSPGASPIVMTNNIWVATGAQVGITP